MMKAGLVSFPKRGTLVATDAGRQLIATNPSHIDINLLSQYPSFEEFYKGDHIDSDQVAAAIIGSPSQSTALQSTPEEQIEKVRHTSINAPHGPVRTDFPKQPHVLRGGNHRSSR